MVFLVLIMILACGIAGFVALMRNLYPDLALTYEVPILFVCFILLQWFLLARLKRYYATQTWFRLLIGANTYHFNGGSKVEPRDVFELFGLDPDRRNTLFISLNFFEIFPLYFSSVTPC